MQHTNTTHFTTSTSPPYPTQLSEFTQPEGTYEGELKDNLKEGLGIFIWQNGDVYFGQWASNKMHGKGIFCFNTGHHIEGNFINGCVNGPACLIYPDGSFVKGVFMNGELQGRVIYYQADKDIWFLQTYEAGKLTGTHYEGNGKPMTYDFCVNIYQEDLQEFSTRSVDSNYRIKSVQKESAVSDSLGCFEIDAETRHFGAIKNNRISGLGLRINGKAIETGKYKDGNLEGFGRKLEFGSILYEGEFAHGKPNGKGTLYQWKNKTLTIALFTCGILVQKIEERAFSLLDLSQLSRAHIHSGDLEILKFAVRSYEDAFAKNYNRTNKKNEDPDGITTTIKEVEYAKVIARETIIEHKHNKSVTHGILQIPENHNIIKHKRSHSSDSVELPFSQAFSVHVNNKQPISNKNHRSVSRDSLRPKNTPNDFIRNKTNYNNQSLKEPPTSLMNNSFSNANKARSTEVSSPSAIPTFGRADEKDYPSVGDLSPQMFNSLSSVQGVSQVSSANPFSAGSYLNFMISSPPSAIEKNPKKYNSQMDLTSNGSSIVSKKETTPTLHYQQKKLNKDRKASKSISGFQSPTQIPFDVKQGHNVNSISPYTYGMFGNLERSPSTSIFSHKHTLSSVQSPSDLQARDWVAMRSPSSAGLNSSTSAKKLKTGESPNKTTNKGNKVLNQILTKKGAGSTSSASISLIKKADASDKGLSNTDKQPSLVYVGSTVYTKKPNVLNNKTKDVSPLNRTGSSFVSGKKDTASKPNKREPSLNGIRSPRMNKLMQVQSPTNFGNTTLQNCSVQEKLLSQKKGDSQGSYKLLVPDRSNTPVRNALTANLSPRISAFTLDVTDTKQTAPKTSRESYYTNEEKLSTRSKSPMITNVDLTMYRSKTPGGISDLDDQRTSTGHPVFGRDPSPLSYRDSASPFGNYNEQDVNQSSTIKLNQEMAMQAARFSFLPAREDQYRSITSKDGQSVDGKFDSLLPDFANKEMSREKIMSPNTSIIENQVVHKRSASQADITQYEKEKQKILNNRYKYQDHRVIDSTIPSRKLTIDTHGSSSPDIFRSNSPYKIDAHQERINSRSKSPQRDKQGVNSPHTPGSPYRHTHDSIDSHSSYYPVKKTCDPKLDPYYNELRQSGCSRKGSSHRGSPLRKSQDLNIVNQGSISSPSLKKEQDQPKESVSNNENLQQKAKISITDIFRKSLNLVQSRAENSIDDAHFDLKALPTVCSRYDNFSDSRVYQRFPTKSSQKQTENSPERQSMTPHKILALRKDSSNQKSIIQKELEREPISEFIAEVTASPSSREDSEPDLGKRIESCLAKTRANIQIIETMDRDNEETQITGVKRPKSNESKSNNLKNIMGVNKSQGSSSSCNKNEFNSKISLRDLKQNLMLENKDLGPQSNRMSTNRTMSSARLKEGQNTKGKEGIEENRGAFTFREEKGAEAVTDQLLDEMVNERKNKVAKDFKRSNSLCKRQNKMAGPLVKTIALYKDDESSEGNATKDKAINVQDFLKEKRTAVRNDNGNEAKRKK